MCWYLCVLLLALGFDNGRGVESDCSLKPGFFHRPWLDMLGNMVPEFGNHVVYRVIRADENPAQGLVARDPNAKISPNVHVGENPCKTQYISTTKDKRVANAWASSTKNRMVRIKLLELPKTCKVIDLTTDADRKKNGLSGFAFQEAKKSEEVLISGCQIPGSVIDIVH